MLRALLGVEKLNVLGRQPALRPGLRIYAIGDIHGRLDLLGALLGSIDADLAGRPAERHLLVFLGDYIDRGTFSRETIDRLVILRKERDCIFLKGNHEQIAIKCLSNPALFDQWMRLGGLETLLSYGVASDHFSSAKPIAALQAAFHQALPQAHFGFFRDLQLSFTCGDFFFAHAGVKPGIELSQQLENDLLWIRDEFLSSRIDFGKIVIHGHTPVPQIEVLANRINIDTGAFATGQLSSVVIEGASISFIDTLRRDGRKTG
jgi:serine/threonine protein phosphatase 1